MRSARPITILIAGAGVVGLAVAALLATGPAAARLQVRVLEARRVPRWRADTVDLRVYALSRGSQTLLERLDLWPRVLASRASPYHRMRVFEGDDPFGTAAIEFDSADVAEPDLGHIVEDSLLRSVLADALAAAPNAEVVEDTTIAGVTLDERRATVRFADGGAADGALLIAADGGDSVVRRLLDWRVAERSYAQTALVTHVATARPHLATAWQRFLPGGPIAFLPLADGRSSIVWSLPAPKAEALLAAAPAELAAAIDTAGAGVLGAVTATTPARGFALKRLHAFDYCRARVVLAGDSAHTVHPLAGQGMNLGLADAAELAATIATAVAAGEDPGDRKVLRRYERARKGASLSRLMAFDALHRLFGLPAWAAPVRGAGLAVLDRLPVAKRALIEAALGR